MATAAFQSVIPNLLPFRFPRALENLLSRALGIEEIARVYDALRSMGEQPADRRPAIGFPGRHLHHVRCRPGPHTKQRAGNRDGQSSLRNSRGSDTRQPAPQDPARRPLPRQWNSQRDSRGARHGDSGRSDQWPQRDRGQWPRASRLAAASTVGRHAGDFPGGRSLAFSLERSHSHRWGMEYQRGPDGGDCGRPGGPALRRG